MLNNFIPILTVMLFFFSTSWKQQPFTKGSYTAIGVGASQSDIESLAQPLYRNVHDKKVINIGQR